MLQAKAASVVAALVNAGYVPSVSADSNSPQNWTITVPVENGVAANTVATFAAGQGVNATVQYVVFT